MNLVSQLTRGFSEAGKENPCLASQSNALGPTALLFLCVACQRKGEKAFSTLLINVKILIRLPQS